MNKYLLGTTALVAASLIAGMASAAEPLKVGVSGNMQQWFGVVNQTTSGVPGNAQNGVTGGRDYANTGLNSDTEIDFKAKTTLDNGLEVEARVEVDVVDNGSGANNGGPNNALGIDEEWASIGSAKYGKIYAGVKESINASMHNEAVDVGIGLDDVDQWIHEPSGMTAFGGGATGGNNNWDRTGLDALINDTASVSYITPQFYGVQFGTTFAPNGQGGTTQTTIGPANRAYHQSNAWDTSLSYTGKLGGVGIGADVGAGGSQGAQNGQSGLTSTAEVWNTGLKFSYMGFTLGAGYFNYNDHLANARSATAALSLDGHSWNTGLSYASGPWAASVMYYAESHRGTIGGVSTPGSSEDHGNETFETYLLSGKYALGPGIDAKATGFYGEYDGRNYGNAGAKYDSKGIGLVTGLDLTF